LLDVAEILITENMTEEQRDEFEANLYGEAVEDDRAARLRFVQTYG
jgi:hypothetical protein